MRILIDARYLDGTYSGIGTYSRNLVENLAVLDTENTYYVLVRSGFRQGLNVGDNFRILSYSAAPVSFSTLFRLGSYVDSLKVDLLHSTFPVAPLRMKTPLMVTMHDLQPLLDPDFSGRRTFPLQWAYNYFYRFVYPATLKKARWVVNVSYHTRARLADFYPELTPKLVVVTSGLDPGHFEPPGEETGEVLERFNLDRPYLLYYGSTRPNKNLKNAVQGFFNFMDEYPGDETELVLILKQDRFFRDVRRLIRTRKKSKRVRVLDQVSRQEQKCLLQRASAFLFPTKYEGFGFPALEAMAANVPVIAGESGALPEICADAAEFVNPDDPQDIASAIAAVLFNTERREELVRLGAERAKQFDWRLAAERVRDIYRLLL